MPDKRPPTITCHDCVVLALDTASTTGWAIWKRQELAGCGAIADVFNASEAMSKLVMDARLMAHHCGDMPLVVVGERPFRDPLGKLSAAWWAWVEVLDAVNVPKKHRHRVYPSVWRSKVLGKGWGSAKRDSAREMEQLLATGVLQSTAAVDPDAAAAIGIGLWALRAQKVGDSLPKDARGEGWQPKPKRQ